MGRALGVWEWSAPLLSPTLGVGPSVSVTAKQTPPGASGWRSQRCCAVCLGWVLTQIDTGEGNDVMPATPRAAA